MRIVFASILLTLAVLTAVVAFMPQIRILGRWRMDYTQYGITGTYNLRFDFPDGISRSFVYNGTTVADNYARYRLENRKIYITYEGYEDDGTRYYFEGDRLYLPQEFDRKAFIRKDSISVSLCMLLGSFLLIICGILLFVIRGNVKVIVDERPKIPRAPVGTAVMPAVSYAPVTEMPATERTADIPAPAVTSASPPKIRSTFKTKPKVELPKEKNPWFREPEDL